MRTFTYIHIHNRSNSYKLGNIFESSVSNFKLDNLLPKFKLNYDYIVSFMQNIKHINNIEDRELKFSLEPTV